MSKGLSIFQQYYSSPEFVDRYLVDGSEGVDVIIPVYHTNELWMANLYSIFREVPVRRLLISDGGCVDNSIELARGLPRVEVFDDRQYKSLGKCVAELIGRVTSDWFIYLHSDVYLPRGWYDKMCAHQGEFDWFGCPMEITVMVSYPLNDISRPLVGSQMGRRKAFAKGLDRIDDDFVYRQEEFVFKRIVEDNGFKEGRPTDTFHYHQVMYRKSEGLDLKVDSVEVVTKQTPKERQRAAVTQVCGIVKYLEPIEPWTIASFSANAFECVERNYMTAKEIGTFISDHNPRWAPYFNRRVLMRRTIQKAARRFLRRVGASLFSP